MYLGCGLEEIIEDTIYDNFFGKKKSQMGKLVKTFLCKPLRTAKNVLCYGHNCISQSTLKKC